MEKSGPDNIVIWNGVTKHDLPPERVLQAAMENKLQSVVILGWDEEGEIYLASSIADGGDVMWLMRKAEKALLEIE